MKINTQQKVLGVVLLIGLVALGIDRSGLAKAHAQPVVAETEAEEAIPAVAPDAAKPVSATSLSARLRALATEAEKSDTRDALAGDQTSQPKRIAIDADVFARDHHLTAVFISRTASHVVIDGRLMKVGDVLQGVRLASIATRTATFAVGEDTIILELAAEPGPIVR